MWIEDEPLREMALRYTAAFPIVLKCHLSTGTGFENDLKGVLRPDELADLCASNHKPLHVIQIVTEVIKQSKVSDFKLSQMDQNLTAFSDVMGACERILRCPIPLSYTRHTSRFILLYCSLLPLVLYKDLGLAMIPTTFIISYAMLGIEQIGVDIEEPFHLIPMGALASLNARNVKAVRDSGDAVRNIVSSTKAANKALV
jgi:putative membrane protein